MRGKIVKILALLIVVLTLGCGESQKELETRCTPVLQEILDIQHMREVIRKDFSITSRLYKSHRAHEEIWQEEKKNWVEKERFLNRKVTNLYDYSYKTGCLE